MNFRAWVKSIKADVGKKELTLSFTVRLDDEALEQAEALAMFAQPESTAVDLDVSPLQKTMDVFLTNKDG